MMAAGQITCLIRRWCPARHVCQGQRQSYNSSHVSKVPPLLGVASLPGFNVIPQITPSLDWLRNKLKKNPCPQFTLNKACGQITWGFGGRQRYIMLRPPAMSGLSISHLFQVFERPFEQVSLALGRGHHPAARSYSYIYTHTYCRRIERILRHYML